MADSSVRIVFSGDSASAQAAVGGLERKFGTLDKVGHRLGRTLSTALKVGALAAAGGITYAIAKAASFEETLNVLQAQTTATRKEMTAVSALAKKLGNDLTLPATSADDAARAMLELSKGGLDLKQSMTAVRGVLLLAAAANTDVENAAQLTTKTLNGFRLEASQSTRVADILANAIAKLSGDYTDYAQALPQVTAVAHQANQSILDTVNALSLLFKGGLAGSDAGTSLKTFFLSLLSPTGKARDLIGDMNIKLRDQGGAILPLGKLLSNLREGLKGVGKEQRDAALKTIFGSDAYRAAAILLGFTNREIERNKRALDEQGGAARLAAARMKGFKGALEGLKSVLETLAINVGEPIIRAITPVIRKVSDFVGWIDTIRKIGKRYSFTFAVKVAWDRGKKWFEDLLFGKKPETTLQVRLENIDPDGTAFKTDGIVQKLQGAFEGINWGAVGDKLIAGIGNIAELGVKIAAAFIRWAFSRDWEAIGRRIGTALYDAVKGLGEKIGDELNIPAIGKGGKEGSQPPTSTFNPLMFPLGPTGQKAGDFVIGLWGGLWDKISGLWEDDANAAVTNVNGILERGFMGGFAGILASARELGAEIGTALAGFAPSIRRIAPTFGEIQDAISGLDGPITEVGTSIDKLGMKRVSPSVEIDTVKARRGLQLAGKDLDDVGKKKTKAKVDIDVKDLKGVLKDVLGQLKKLDANDWRIKVKSTAPEVRDKVKSLLDVVKKVDAKDRKIKITSTAPQVQPKVESLIGKVKDLDRQKADPKVTVDGQQALSVLASIRSALASIRSKSVTVTTRRVQGAAGGGFIEGGPLSPIKRAVGGFIPGGWSDSTPDSVPAMLKPGELVLNRPQQNMLGGPGFLARLFGFTAPSDTRVQRLAGGGFVSSAGASSALQGIISRDKKRSGYKAKSKAVTSLQRRLENTRDKQDRIVRSIGLDADEFDVSVEEFIRVDANGNEILDTAAVQKRIGEIDSLIGRYQNELLPAIDEETQILQALIAALEAAVAAWKAEIRDQERVIRETTELIRDATKKMNDTTDQAAKDSYQKVISKAEETRSNARSKISDLKGEISTAQDDKRGVQNEQKDQPLDRREVTIGVQRLQAERAEVAATTARPAEPTSASAEGDAAASGADGFSSTDTGGTGGPDLSAQNAVLEALNAAFKRQLSVLKLALGVEGVQLPIIASFQTGSLHVPQTGFYHLHAGEQVRPAGYAGAQMRRGSGGGIEEVLIRLEVDKNLDRWVDAKIVGASPRVSVVMGGEADRRGRSGEAGTLSAPVRRLG